MNHNVSQVFIGLASIPQRRNSLEQVVRRLLPQCGQMGVYLNNWDEVPYFLRNPKISVVRSQDHGDARDNGKFFFVESSQLRYYASVDDDIEYPHDYIEKMLAHQSRVGAGLVGVHATYYPAELTSLLGDRFVAHFKEGFESLLPATLIGTGTALFDRFLVDLKYKEFGAPGMADVWLAVAAKKRGLSLWTVPRPDRWLKPIPQVGTSEVNDLYTEGKNDDSVQLNALRAAGIRGSIPNILESIMRCPSAAVSFSFREAEFLWSLTRQIAIEGLRKRDRPVYAYSLVRHKEVSLQRKNQVTFQHLVEPYSNWMLELASRGEGSVIRDEWIDGYLSLCGQQDDDLAPVWIKNDSPYAETIREKFLRNLATSRAMQDSLTSESAL